MSEKVESDVKLDQKKLVLGSVVVVAAVATFFFAFLNIAGLIIRSALN